MERRQRWLEAQFRRQDECLSKIAKQLQVLQDFISLNFDSYRQYALEREREERISHLTYGHIDKPHTQQGHNYHETSPPAHSQYPSRLTPLPPPDHFSHHIPSNNPGNSESDDYDDGDMMEAAPGESDPPPTGIPVNQIPIVAVDLSTERRRYQQNQEPNSTVTDYAVAAYYGLTSRCGDEMALPDSGLIDEGPTDLSTEKKNRDEGSPPIYQGSGNAEGSILGGILTAHMQPKIKTEVKEEEEPSHCFIQYPRSRTASTDSASKDKEYSSQALWSAGTVTAVTVGGPGSTCSTDEIAEHPSSHPTPPKIYKEEEISSRSENTSDHLQNFLLEKETPISKSEKKQAKEKGKGGRGRKRRVSRDDSGIAPSSTASSTRRSPSTTTTSSGEHSTATSSSSSGKKGSSHSNASKQCRFCGKTFQWLHSVKTHERLHTGIKPYGCKICGARFTQNGNLKVHAKTCVEKHAESYRSRNVHICSVCTEMFSDKNALMDHQKSHDRMQWTIKEKTCQLCGEVFQKRSFLLEHEKVHVQDRSFLNSLGIEAETTGGGNSSSASVHSNSGSSEKID